MYRRNRNWVTIVLYLYSYNEKAVLVAHSKVIAHILNHLFNQITEVHKCNCQMPLVEEGGGIKFWNQFRLRDSNAFYYSCSPFGVLLLFCSP